MPAAVEDLAGRGLAHALAAEEVERDLAEPGAGIGGFGVSHVLLLSGDGPHRGNAGFAL